MGMPLPYDGGSEISLRTAIEAGTTALVANSGVDVNGIAIDRQGETAGANSGGTGGPSNAGLAESAVFNFRAVANAGSPTLTNLKGRIQDSADGSTAWADFIPDVLPGSGGNPTGIAAKSTAGVTALGTDGNIRVDLRQARRFVRMVLTPTFTGGATSLFLNSNCALAGFKNTPVITPSNP